MKQQAQVDVGLLPPATSSASPFGTMPTKVAIAFGDRSERKPPAFCWAAIRALVFGVSA